ncbi:MAG TPA: N,N-dimethylformamidase beta subunit family domain-containing protein [Polyangiales bacterium]|nr:N,N-dimethylformamidase beta subunit family domain-containing protein [Polyangiales bacterium]
MTSKEAVEGYCLPLSVEPGQRVALHAAATQRVGQAAAGPAEHELHVDIEIARIGAERHVVQRLNGLIARPQPIAADAYARGANFPVLATIDVGRDYPSGYYEVRMRTHRADGTRVERCACFVLRPAPNAARNRPLLALATNTWNAYNDWGGANLYTSATHVSFARPFAHGLLDRPDPLHHRNTNRAPDPDLTMRAYTEYLRAQRVCVWSGSAGFASFERPFVEWAERAGYALDYATSADLEDHPELLLQGRPLYLSVGHDEYWSSGMRDSVEAFIARGGNALFLSGNTCCWQVRYEDAGATLVSYKGRARRDDPTSDPRLLTSLWSDPRIGRPETKLTGLTFTRGGYHRIGGGVPRGAGGYTIWRPKHWLFAGTDLRYGDLFGAEHGVVGYECDGCALTLQDGLPVPTGEDGCPPGFEVLGSAPARIFSVDADGNEYPEGLAQTRDMGELQAVAITLFGNASPESVRKIAHGNAVLGTYTAGGTVVSCGSTDWVFGLAGGDPLVERVTRNALDRLSR